MDLDPQYSGNDLFIHYGSPIVTPMNNVILPVKTGAGDGFKFEERRATDGTLLWTQATDYSLPPYGWIPSCAGTMSGWNTVAMPAGGGTILLRPSDIANATATRIAFYGNAVYNANSSQYQANVKICTPLTQDLYGNVYFGFRVLGANDANLTSGYARVTPSGAGTWVSAAAATGNSNYGQPVLNCAPAISPDGQTMYVAINGGGWSGGQLVALRTSSLQTIGQTDLFDPKSGVQAYLPDDGTASPIIGPDGDVYFGIEENPYGSNHLRGWLLHFDRTLAVAKPFGAFGWDDTPSIVPSYAVPSYTGSSSYLLLSKYNNYVEGGGDGVNKVAVLDPNTNAVEPVSGIPCMKEILLRPGPTPDSDFPNNPGAVREWCINSAVVDAKGRCAIVNNEDGRCYRWDLTNNKLTQTLVLTPGIGEAYTPTLMARGGISFAINNATLFAMGQ